MLFDDLPLLQDAVRRTRRRAEVRRKGGMGRSQYGTAKILALPGSGSDSRHLTQSKVKRLSDPTTHQEEQWHRFADLVWARRPK